MSATLNEKGPPHGDGEGPEKSHQAEGLCSNNAKASEKQGKSTESGVGGGAASGAASRAARHYRYPCGEENSGGEEDARWVYFAADDAPRFLKIKKTNFRDNDGNIIRYENGSPIKKYPTACWTPVNEFSRAYDGNPNNWTWKIPEDVPRILFNLNLLSKAAPGAERFAYEGRVGVCGEWSIDPLIIVTEGEKDAETAIDVGLGVGTCSILGAVKRGGKGWEASYDQYLAGHDVILTEDNDNAGRVHVREVGRQLKDVAKSLRVIRFVEVDGKPTKSGFDLTDFYDLRKSKGKTEDEIKAELLGMVEEWKEGPDYPKKAPTLEEFVAYMPQHDYIYLPTRAHWPASSVNSQIAPITVGVDEKGKDVKIKASAWLDQNHAVEQKAWAPGEPEFISGKLVINGGWMQKSGATCFNEYLPSAIKPGDASKAGPWVEFVKKLYPKDHGHIIAYFASKVQRPDVKVNHCLLLGGAPGIGKDTLIEPLIHAVGPHNFQDVSPKAICGDFNGWAKGVVVRISELRDLGDISRFDFYEHSKTLMAAPPEVVRINEKHIREYYAFNVCGVIMTTNHKAGGIYLPADDRRHYVAWSESGVGDITEDEFNELWGWYKDGGFEHVAAYLSQLDLSGFDPKAKPPKTDAFWDIVNSNRSSEENELSDVIEEMGDPPALTVDQIRIRVSCESLAKWLADPKNGSAITRRLEKCGYTPVNNPTATGDKQWRIFYLDSDKKKPRRKTVYARKMMKGADGIERPATEMERLSAAEALATASRDDAPHDQPQNRM